MPEDDAARREFMGRERIEHRDAHSGRNQPKRVEVGRLFAFEQPPVSPCRLIGFKFPVTVQSLVRTAAFPWRVERDNGALYHPALGY